MTKKDALLRRANIFISWVEKRDYKTYKDDDSIDTAVRLINMIIYALEVSLPAEDWQPFLLMLKECKVQVLDTYETEEDLKLNYEQAITTLLSVLEHYKAHTASLYN